MAIFFPPVPPVQTGGAQPYGQKKLAPDIMAVPVNEPPYTIGGPFALKAEIATIAQPNPWVYTFLGRGQPFEPRKLNPSITAVRVDTPPSTYGGPIASTAEIISLNQPTIWPYTFVGAAQPYDYRRANPSLTDVRVDNPPFGMRGAGIYAELISVAQPDPWTYKFMGWQGPYMPHPVPVSIEISSGFFRVYIFV